MGFIEETGAAQHFRDARITTIYEGTTGIQANDFIGRKTARDGGAEARSVAGRDGRRSPRELARHADANLKAIGTRLADGIARGPGGRRSGWSPAYGANPRAAHAVAVPYLDAVGARHRRLAARPRRARGGEAPRRRRRRRALSHGQDPHGAFLRRGAAAAGGGARASRSARAASRRWRSRPSSSDPEGPTGDPAAVGYGLQAGPIRALAEDTLTRSPEGQARCGTG